MIEALEWVKFKNINESLIQIYGEGVHGFAFKVNVPGNLKKVWHYDLRIHNGQSLHMYKSNRNEGTMINEDRLKERVWKVTQEILNK